MSLKVRVSDDQDFGQVFTAYVQRSEGPCIYEGEPAYRELRKLTRALSALVEALSPVLPNHVLCEILGGAISGTFCREGQRGDVPSLKAQLDQLRSELATAK